MVPILIENSLTFFCKYWLYRLVNPWIPYQKCYTPQLYHLKVHFLSVMFNPLHSKNCSKITLIKVVTMKNTDNFHCTNPSCATTKSTLIAVNKDEWDTKEDTGKSMKNIHCTYYSMPKGTSRLKWRQKWKNQAYGLSHYRVTHVWRHQLVSQ